MFKNIEDFYSESKSLVSDFDYFSIKNKLSGKAKSDHICYKCSSSDEFESIRKLFEEESIFVYQSIISKRRIAVIRMKRGIETVLGEISILELSDQKPDGTQKSGFDHIEIYPVKISYEELVKKVKDSGLDVKEVVRPHHSTFDIKIGKGYLVRLEEEPLIEKIKREEIN